MKPSEMSDEQLIRAVAQEVMDKDLQGQSTWWISCKSGSFQDSFIPWNPITDYNHMMMVVKRMRGLGWSFALYTVPSVSSFAWGYTAMFCFGVIPPIRDEARNVYQVRNDNLGRAVCEAAMEAVKNV